MEKVILVVDDEEDIRLLYKDELTDEGYEIVLAENGKEALEKIKEKMPDLITLDIRMPKMDGMEFLRRLREIDRDLPVILCTAYGDYRRDFRAWASDVYITKSSNLDELKTTIKQLLSKQKKD
ncbi:MAG: response regulator [bacterium]